MNNRYIQIGMLVITLLVLMLTAKMPDNWAEVINPLPLPNQSEVAVLTKEQIARMESAVFDADLIRVGISSDSMTELEYPSVTISASGPYTVRLKSSYKPVFSAPGGKSIRVSKQKSGFVLSPGGGPYNDTLIVKVDNPETARLTIPSITRKGKVPSYRGHFELTPGHSSPSKFTVVNILPLQDYLKAVVPNELPPSYGFEAVKAQSVAARNYAIRPREKPWPQFDICDSQYCQAYYGAGTEHPEATRALKETHGLVALYQGEPILALYSSSHGGYQESYENAFSDPHTNKFPATPLPYLRGGPDRGSPRDLRSEEGARAFYSNKNAASFDILSPHYRWEKTWGRRELEQIINHHLAVCSQDKLTSAFVKPQFKTGQTIGTLKRLNPVKRGISGKLMQLEIVGTNGTWLVEKEFVIRKVLQHSGRFLPSANVIFNHLTDKDGNLTAIKAVGGGFGHGVGMSQLGASYLSKHGKNFTDIIQHYYKDVAIGTIPLIAKSSQGMKTEFYAPNAQGKLNLVSFGSPRPVQVEINDQLITVEPKSDGKAVVDISQHIRPRVLNTLKVYPLPQSEESDRAKVWVEIVEPRPSAS